MDRLDVLHLPVRGKSRRGLGGWQGSVHALGHAGGYEVALGHGPARGIAGPPEALAGVVLNVAGRADDALVAMLLGLLSAMEERKVRLYRLAIATNGRPLNWFKRPAYLSVGEVLPDCVFQVLPSVFLGRHSHPPILGTLPSLVMTLNYFATLKLSSLRRASRYDTTLTLPSASASSSTRKS